MPAVILMICFLKDSAFFNMALSDGDSHLRVATPRWAHILVQVTIHRTLLIGRDGRLDQSEAYDVS